MFGIKKTTRKPYCQCLDEIQRGGPRTRFCLMPCADQREIMRLEAKAALVADPVKLQAQIAQLEQQLNELKNNPPTSHSALLLHAMEKELEERIGECKSRLPKTES